MAKSKITLSNWKAGITTSDRANSPEEFNSGFSLISNFDIYSHPNKVTPLGEFERWNTEEEEQYGFKGIGVNTETVFATGYTDTSWYGSYSHRVKITPDFYDTVYLAYSLANMPAGFWSVVDSSGKDIKVVDKDGEFVASDLIQFDYSANTGFLCFPVNASSDYFYIYYGNSETSSVVASIYDQLGRANAYPGYGNVYIMESGYPISRRGNPIGDTVLSEGSIPTYSNGGNGFIGKAIGQGSYFNDNEKPNIYNDSNNSVAVTIKVDNSISGTTIGTVASYAELVLNPSGLVTHTWNNETQASFSVNSSFPVNFNANNRIVISYTEAVGATIHINGVLAATSTNNISDDLEDNGWWIQWVVGASEQIGDVMYSSAYSTSRALHEYNMLFDNANYFTTGAQETKPALGQYGSGLSLYQKTLDGNSWKVVDYGIPAVSRGWLPDYAPILTYGTRNIVYFGIRDVYPFALTDIRYNPSTTELLDDNNPFGLFIALPSVTGNHIPSALAIDNKYYVGEGGTQIHRWASTGDGQAGVFYSYPRVRSIEDYNGYLAIGGEDTKGDSSYIQLWDRAGTQAVENISVGKGRLQNIGNIKGTLFAVVNNFIDDDNKSIQNRSMDIRVTTGGGQMRTTHKIMAPFTMDGFYSNIWESPVSQFKCTNKNAVLFYAKVPNDEGSYNEGLWALGKNEATEELALSLAYDTSYLGDIYGLSSIGNQVIALHDTSKVSRLSLTPNYSRPSVIRTKKYNHGNSETDKKLEGVEIMHETLTGNQTIDVYKKNEKDTSWVHILTSSANNEESLTSKETTVDINGDALGDFREIEFKIVSTGGSASITQFCIKLDTLTNNV